ncbi:MAG: hypothetical protein H0W74_09540 [Sphingosinicella sp.]|nr:hypothetical protein [Sphingosinicella sp.]
MAETIVNPLHTLANEAGEYRAVKAVRQREDAYTIIGPMGEDEGRQFPPGSLVRRKARLLSNGKQEMVATSP